MQQNIKVRLKVERTVRRNRQEKNKSLVCVNLNFRAAESQIHTLRQKVVIQ